MFVLEETVQIYDVPQEIHFDHSDDTWPGGDWM
jgi:hypothetical protein